jgi:hypothetical protein
MPEFRGLRKHLVRLVGTTFLIGPDVLETFGTSRSGEALLDHFIPHLGFFLEKKFAKQCLKTLKTGCNAEFIVRLLYGDFENLQEIYKHFDLFQKRSVWRLS